MARPIVYSIIESPGHPNLSALYRRLGMEELRLPSQRKAVRALKEHPPDWVVAEFFYGFGNNYAGANLSNLDVFLGSLQRYAPRARVLVLVAKDQRPYVDRLAERFPIHAVLTQPIHETEIEAVLAPEER